MAEQVTRDVVKEAQSMGGSPPIDGNATSTQNSAGDGEAPSAQPTTNPKLSETTSTNATTDDKDKDRVAEIAVSDKAGSDAAAKSSAADGDQEKAENTTLAAKGHPTGSETGEHSAAEDSSAHNVAGEASGGSDTDISRPGSVDQTKDRATGHIRSSSLKKATAFKSVSVTKNFLAKSAVSTPSARPGDKAAPLTGQSSTSTLQTAKPRLVAKSGSGLGVSRSSLSKANGAGSGPDASKVWNKNQPVPPPPPKQFTDEELKQQYGIHLATRLQADESSKEAKWADIDDDEDDWAPDTVQWMDGTKSSVAAAAVEKKSPPEEVKPTIKKDAPEPVKPTAAPVPVSQSQRPSSTSGNKTILKPGAHSQSTTGKAGLVLKGQPEKPTLVAKPSTGAPVKSPWAPLPPVDKASPVQINPPPQQPPPHRFAQAHVYDSGPPSHAPTREIAPDDFNRSWRDDRGSRELFNSHSGRYEPVNDMRRGSVRDGSIRQQPSVLQRPTQDGPAEPSAAFQTSRTSADVPAWSRRRTSSNVSGGSGRLLADRRTSELPPVPLNIQRRESHSMIAADAARTGPAQKTPGDAQHIALEQHPGWTQKASPSLSNAQPVSPYGSVGSAALHEGATPTMPVPIEDAVEVQNRLMREKLERARLAKQKEREREEREEAERKERLRKKLEAMGLADDPKTKAKDRSPSRPVVKSPQKEKAVPVPVQSPPKPPVPTAEGEVAQYGMIKVHQPHPVKRQQAAESPKLPKVAHDSPQSSTSPVKSHTEVPPAAPSSSAPSTSKPLPTSTPIDPKIQAAQPSSQVPAQQPEGDTRPNNQGLKPAQPPPSAWSSTLPQQSRPWGSNVWGPPQARDRALGNGTFEAGYNSSQPRPGPQQLPAQSQPVQAPTLGLAQQLRASPAQPQGVPQPPLTQQTMYAATEIRPMQGPAGGRPAPIAPPNNRWANFREVIAQDDQAIIARAQKEQERMKNETFRPEIREVYTNQQGQSQKTVHSQIGAIKSDAPGAVGAELKPKDESAKQTHISEPVAPIGQVSHTTGAGTGARSSRFFPRATDITPQPPAATGKSASPPPPPPEVESHPAYADEMHGRPVVKLPKLRPRVRLPPTASETAHVEGPVSMPEGPSSSSPRTRIGFGHKPLALNPEWQARFNSLLEKPNTSVLSSVAPKPAVAVHSAHARPSALAVAASSKAPLEERHNMSSATVSLPNNAVKKSIVMEIPTEFTTRSSAEEQLLEEREFGSLPVVNVPKTPHLAANERAAPFPPNRPNTRYQRGVDVMTKPAFYINDFDRNSDTIDVIVRVANMAGPITKSMARKRPARSAANHKGPKRNYSNNSGASNTTQSQRPRKPSNFQNQGSNTSHSPRSAGGNAWATNRSNAAHTASTWTRRADPVH